MPPKPAQLCHDSVTILERSRELFLAQRDELFRLRIAVMKSFHPDDIHDLRVASRRFRSLLELYYPFLPKRTKKELRVNVRKLTKILGGLRNIDEALLFFHSQSQADDSDGGKLCNMLSQLRSVELKRIKKALAEFDPRELGNMVRKVVAALREDSRVDWNSISLLTYFSDVSIRQYHPIHKLFAVSTKPELGSTRHALRIAVKKWRYFFEIIAQILDRNYAPHLGLLKEYQSVLGRMNDIAEFRSLLGNLRLPKNEMEFAKALLIKEEGLLLQNYTELTEQKPLAYKFLI